MAGEEERALACDRETQPPVSTMATANRGLIWLGWWCCAHSGYTVAAAPVTAQEVGSLFVPWHMLEKWFGWWLDGFKERVAGEGKVWRARCGICSVCILRLHPTTPMQKRCITEVYWCAQCLTQGSSRAVCEGWFGCICGIVCRLPHAMPCRMAMVGRRVHFARGGLLYTLYPFPRILCTWSQILCVMCVCDERAGRRGQVCDEERAQVAG